MVISGDVSSFDDTQRDSLKGTLRETLGCFEPVCILELRVSAAGSIAVSAILTIPDAPTTSTADPAATVAAVEAAATALAAEPPASISESLGVTVVSAPTVEPTVSATVPLAVAPPPPSPPPLVPPPAPPSAPSPTVAAEPDAASSEPADSPIGLIVGGAGGAVVAAIVAVLLYRRYRRSAASARKEQTSPPSITSGGGVSFATGSPRASTSGGGVFAAAGSPRPGASGGTVSFAIPAQEADPPRKPDLGSLGKQLSQRFMEFSEGLTATIRSSVVQAEPPAPTRASTVLEWEDTSPPASARAHHDPPLADAPAEPARFSEVSLRRSGTLGGIFRGKQTIEQKFPPKPRPLPPPSHTDYQPSSRISGGRTSRPSKLLARSRTSASLLLKSGQRTSFAADRSEGLSERSEKPGRLPRARRTTTRAVVTPVDGGEVMATV